MKEIYLAGGCFWGMEAYFKKIEGVIDATSGYANSMVENPTYEAVCMGKTCASEAIKVVYDDSKITLPILLQYFFRVIDPTLLNQQGNDKGTQYRTGIYTNDRAEQELSIKALELLQRAHQKPIVVEVMALANFTNAEEYHQEYLDKNPNGYCHISLYSAIVPLDQSELANINLLNHYL